MNDAEVIEKVQGVIEAQEWCRDYLQDDDGRVCLRGAFLTVLLGITDATQTWFDPNSAQAWSRIRQIEQDWIVGLLDEDIVLPDDVVRWNNDPGRLEDEVLDVLTKAAHNARMA